MDLTMNSVQEIIHQLLIQNFKLSPEKLVPEARLREDLDLDSIDLVDLLSLINEKINLHLSPHDFEGCTNLVQFGERLNKLALATKSDNNPPKQHS